MSKKTEAAYRRQLKNAAPMISVLDDGTWPTKPVTLENLLNHYEKYGWDRKKQGSGRKRRWIDKTYRTYHQMRSDSLVEIARAYLGRDDYLELVATLGRPEFVEQAIDEEGWTEFDNGEQDETDVRTQGYGSELGGIERNDGYDPTDPTQARTVGQDSGSSSVKGQVPSIPGPLVSRG